MSEPLNLPNVAWGSYHKILIISPGVIFVQKAFFIGAHYQNFTV